MRKLLMSRSLRIWLLGTGLGLYCELNTKLYALRTVSHLSFLLGGQQSLPRVTKHCLIPEPSGLDVSSRYKSPKAMGWGN
ncbi:hypothetical protein QBC42DRAFT_108436 [Cladorrhinum samala]|uniref:Secreted protein n=1 Tax=Cladorrhinum samala TaxID=585594 RepID=A0AAV9HYP5_9PEZI|nr:hypothetical protein QBC42DRAFT_108436 [Cladorrhinum samala]